MSREKISSSWVFIEPCAPGMCRHYYTDCLSASLQFVVRLSAFQFANGSVKQVTCSVEQIVSHVCYTRRYLNTKDCTDKGDSLRVHSNRFCKSLVTVNRCCQHYGNDRVICRTVFTIMIIFYIMSYT